jgi:hypothetical protein
MVPGQSSTAVIFSVARWPDYMWQWIRRSVGGTGCTSSADCIVDAVPGVVSAGRIRPERGARHDVGLVRTEILGHVERQARGVIPPSTSNGEIQRRLDSRAYPTARPVSEVAVADEDRAVGLCETCPHPWSSHDRISIRFCTATKVSGDSRRCVCPAKETG